MHSSIDTDLDSQCSIIDPSIIQCLRRAVVYIRRSQQQIVATCPGIRLDTLQLVLHQILHQLLYSNYIVSQTCFLQTLMQYSFPLRVFSGMSSVGDSYSEALFATLERQLASSLDVSGQGITFVCEFLHILQHFMQQVTTDGRIFDRKVLLYATPAAAFDSVSLRCLQLYLRYTSFLMYMS